jgi:hypothetical protein
MTAAVNVILLSDMSIKRSKNDGTSAENEHGQAVSPGCDAAIDVHHGRPVKLLDIPFGIA